MVPAPVPAVLEILFKVFNYWLKIFMKGVLLLLDIFSID